MTKRVFRLFAVLPVLLLGLVAQGAQFRFSTVLLPGNEIANPAVVSNGTGTGDVYYDDIAHTLQVFMTWQDLTGTTTASHMHAPANATQISTAIPFNGTWGVATQPGTFTGFPVGTTSGTYSGAAYSLLNAANFTSGFVTANGGTLASAEAALLNYMNTGKAYLNIHTTAYPAGEIKGYLRAVPDGGSTLVLLALALSATVGMARRQKLARH
jgi:hypothetical protein